MNKRKIINTLRTKLKIFLGFPKLYHDIDAVEKDAHKKIESVVGQANMSLRNSRLDLLAVVSKVEKIEKTIRDQQVEIEKLQDETHSGYRHKNKYCVCVGNGESLSEMKILPEIFTSEKKAWESMHDKWEKYPLFWILKIQLAGEHKNI